MWVNACEMDYLEAVVDASPLRAGKLMPGTHTPIVFPDRVSGRPTLTIVFITAWNYAERDHGKEAGITGIWAVPSARISDSSEDGVASPPCWCSVGRGMLGSTACIGCGVGTTDWSVDGTSAHEPMATDARREAASGLWRSLTLVATTTSINCIGVLKSAHRRLPIHDRIERAVRVNAIFPHELAAAAAHMRTRVIHVSTDAVFSGTS